jgi:hypothetical protein
MKQRSNNPVSFEPMLGRLTGWNNFFGLIEHGYIVWETNLLWLGGILGQFGNQSAACSWRSLFLTSALDMHNSLLLLPAIVALHIWNKTAGIYILFVCITFVFSLTVVKLWVGLKNFLSFSSGIPLELSAHTWASFWIPNLDYIKGWYGLCG